MSEEDLPGECNVFLQEDHRSCMARSTSWRNISSVLHTFCEEEIAELRPKQDSKNNKN